MTPETKLIDDDALDAAAPDRADLKRASIHGVAINFGAQLLKFVIQFGYQITIMRLLAPGDFGLMAMAAPVLAFVQMFTDFGLSQAVIQRKHISQQQLSFLFWFNVGVSALISLLTIGFAPLAGMFYHEPRAALIVASLGGLLFLSGLQAQHTALLNRRMAYGKLAAITLTGLVAGAVTGIVTALMGAGYWALVYNQAAMSVSSLLLLLILARWRPSRPARVANIKDLLGFGGNVTGFNIVNFFARNLDNVLIGRAWGEAALGLYDRAYKLLLLPLNQIVAPFSTVALPLLSRTLDEPPVYRRAFLRVLETIILFTYPGIIFAMCASRQLIVTVLGARWEGVAPIFAILAIGGLMAPVSNATGWLFTSQNRTREMRNWGIVSSALFVLSFAVGLHWGPVGVAACYIGIGLFQGPLVWWAATKQGPVSLRDTLGALYPFALAGLMALLAVLGLQAALPESPLSLVALFLAAHLAFIATLACLPQGRALFADLWAQAHHLMTRQPKEP